MTLSNLDRIFCIFTGALIGLNANVALAQSAPPTERAAPPSTGRFESLLNGVSVEFDLSEDESLTSIQIGGFDVANFDDGDDLKQKSIAWKLGLDIPFGGQDNIIDGNTLDALGDGIKISGAINLLSFNGSASKLTSKPFTPLHDQAIAACKLTAPENPATIANCDRARDYPTKQFAVKYLPGREDEINNSLFSGFSTFGVRASVGVNRFDYVMPGTLAELDSSKFSYSAAAVFAYYPSNALSVWKAEIEYASAFEAVDDSIVCKTVIVNPDDDCVKAAAAAPTREESLVLRGEYRHFFPMKNGKSGIGAALTGSWDTLSGEYGVELPVYYHIGGSAPISPGVKVGYSSKDDDVSVGIFLKTSFSF